MPAPIASAKLVPMGTPAVRGRGSRRRLGPLAAVVLPGAATLLALMPRGVSTTSAALAYVLAVTGAAAVGGVGAGIAASILSFLALNFFFTAPLHTFRVDKTEDLMAMVVFLLVSGTVGVLLSSALTQRQRAERREREARLLHHLGSRLLAGETSRDVVRSFARAVTDLFGLKRCEILTDLVPEPVLVERDGGAAGPSESIPMVVREQEVGRVTITAGASPLGEEERRVIQGFANQMGLALESVRLSEEAATARLDAESNRLRAALFSSVTHDLRTPLSSIMTSATSLLSEESVSTPEHRELLETIRQEADRLNRLVGNLLDLSRIRAGALVPTRSPASIDEIIEGVVGRLQPLLQGHEVRLLLKDDLPDVPVDVVQIDQVLTNLLENAAKFSPEGGPISVSAARWHGSVEVRVSDRGPGIGAESRERVFEPFVGEGPRSGAGLGLAIAKAIVESHGGRIWIEGAPGGGASVVFQLPLQEPR